MAKRGARSRGRRVKHERRELFRFNVVVLANFAARLEVDDNEVVVQGGFFPERIEQLQTDDRPCRSEHGIFDSAPTTFLKA